MVAFKFCEAMKILFHTGTISEFQQTNCYLAEDALHASASVLIQYFPQSKLFLVFNAHIKEELFVNMGFSPGTRHILSIWIPVNLVHRSSYWRFEMRLGRISNICYILGLKRITRFRNIRSLSHYSNFRYSISSICQTHCCISCSHVCNFDRR